MSDSTPVGRRWRTPLGAAAETGAPPARHARWVLARTHSGQHVLRLVGGNGETVMVTETHPDKRNALAALEVVDEANEYRVVNEAGHEVDW